jgi:hypothetical protein
VGDSKMKCDENLNKESKCVRVRLWEGFRSLEKLTKAVQEKATELACRLKTTYTKLVNYVIE